MQCRFVEEVNNTDGSYCTSICLNQAQIFFTDDPCFGLCFTCAYEKIKAENEKLRDLLQKVVEIYEDPTQSNLNKMYYIQSRIALIKQVLKGKS